jgi:tetratricopeptide (TPR) repeat protein
MDGGGLVLRETEEVARISKGVENKDVRETAGVWGRKPNMTDSRPDCREAEVPGGKCRWMQCGVFGAVCALVIGLYAYTAHSGWLELMSLNAADTYYNLLVQGFRAGQLSLKKEAPPGLAQLADPYDPTANALYLSASYRMLDMSYYKGRLYLYFGVTPALILFWPFAALTGHYLFHRQAVAIFCALGFLVSVGLLRALWRRYFAEVNVGVVAACVLGLGLATGVPVLLPRSDVYEVAISCGYMLTMLALGALWCALHEPERRCRWLSAASVAYGLALGARPNLLFGAVILLVPVVQAWRERRPIGALLMAATGPITVIGLGLMLYNGLRFDSPFEFGWHYMLGPRRQDTGQQFSLHYLWFNFRAYFLEPVRWSGRFPFVGEIALPPLPLGHHGVGGKAFGVLTNIPLVWLTLTVPLAWRSRSAEARSILHGFLAAVTLLVGICAVTLCIFFAADMRYEVDFLPALVLLAVVGILGLEQALAPLGAGLAERPVWRRAVRSGWGLLLAFSVAFNLLSGVENYAETQCNMGNALLRAGRVQEAIAHYEQALRIMPDYPTAYNDLGVALWQAGKVREAIGHYEKVLRIMPDYAEAHHNLGVALASQGKVAEAIAEYAAALRIKPDYAEAHHNLAIVLAGQGRVAEAITEYAAAVRIKPDYAEAHHNLGTVLAGQGRVAEAITEYRASLRIKPDNVEAHNNLGVALARQGNVAEAIAEFAAALRIKPDNVEAHNNLGVALASQGRVSEAIAEYAAAVRIKPDYAEAHCNLGLALAQTGKIAEAIAHYEQALRIKPDFTQARNALARLQAGQ